jgi:soluble lytic murein transglycosylase-like protein
VYAHRAFEPNLKTIVGLVTAALAVLALAASPVSASSGGIGSDGKPGGGTGSSSSSSKYQRLWDRVSSHDKRWAKKTSKCESGGNPKAIGGGGRYRGAFQFMKQTWRNAPKSPGGDPIKYAYTTQAVVAVYTKHRDGAGQWPVCG